LRSITDAKATTDRLDARMLAKLLMSGLLDPVLFWFLASTTTACRRTCFRT
jgi:hypothetical protein